MYSYKYMKRKYPSELSELKPLKIFLTEKVILCRVRYVVLNDMTILRYSRNTTGTEVCVYFCDGVMYSVFKLFCLLQ
jgi:hypothetical protein